MIEINGVSKNFGSIRALDEVNAVIKSGSIFGLIGSNGSGKSTLLRTVCGIFAPDTGSVTVDGAHVWENSAVKQNIVYLSDEQYFIPHSTISDMMKIYRAAYAGFSQQKYSRLCDLFNLDTERKLNTFSKGMQKQAAILLGLSCRPKYLLCDETFDGLDPVVRQMVKRVLAEDVAESGMTPVIASHNLRELEDICDRVGLLHKGGILFERDIDDLKFNIHKVQAVFKDEMPADSFSGLDIVSFSRRGSLVTVVARGKVEDIMVKINALSPVFAESIPLTLEEIFISEMENRGYDFSKIII